MTTQKHDVKDDVVRVADDEKQLTEQFVQYIVQVVHELAKTRPFITIGLSGGSAIKPFAQALIRHKPELEPHLDKLRFILCDERFVPFDSPDSTYSCYVKEGLFETLGIAPENVSPIKVDAESCADCARDYVQRLRPLLNENGGFDILQLGMGPDGHTCSLFPGHELVVNAAKYADELVVPIVDSPKPPPQRVTLTLDAVNRSRHVLFFLWGESKADMVRRILIDRDESLPSALVQPVAHGGQLKWFVDKPCASKLNL